MDSIKVSENLEYEMHKYMQKIFRETEKIYMKGELNPINFADIIYLASIAIKMGQNKEKWEEIGFKLCYEIKQCVEIYKIHQGNTAILAGFGYICFAVKNYADVSGHLKKFSESLHKLLVEETKKKMDFKKDNWESTKSDDFDCISGASGLLLYLTTFDDILDGDLYKDVIVALSDYLINLTKTHTYLDNETYNFHIPCEMQYLEEEKKKFPNGNFNFGMAHGMVGPLVALSRVYRKGYNSAELLNAIEVLFEFYRTFSVEVGENTYWPGQLSYEDFKKQCVSAESIHYASSWCYGNVGILCGLIYTCENMEWLDEQKKLERSLFAALNKPLKEFYLVSPALCHGLSGILCALIFLSKRCNDEKLSDKSESVIKRIITLSNRNTKWARLAPEEVETEMGRLEGYLGEYSMLNGVTGIVSVFAEILYEIDVYRSLIMLS